MIELLLVVLKMLDDTRRKQKIPTHNEEYFLLTSIPFVGCCTEE
jgi:hypothetical protein